MKMFTIAIVCILAFVAPVCHVCALDFSLTYENLGDVLLEGQADVKYKLEAEGEYHLITPCGVFTQPFSYTESRNFSLEQKHTFHEEEFNLRLSQKIGPVEIFYEKPFTKAIEDVMQGEGEDSTAPLNLSGHGRGLNLHLRSRSWFAKATYLVREKGANFDFFFPPVWQSVMMGQVVSYTSNLSVHQKRRAIMVGKRFNKRLSIFSSLVWEQSEYNFRVNVNARSEFSGPIPGGSVQASTNEELKVNGQIKSKRRYITLGLNLNLGPCKLLIEKSGRTFTAGFNFVVTRF